jgi:hypothetical protein
MQLYCNSLSIAFIIQIYNRSIRIFSIINHHRVMFPVCTFLPSSTRSLDLTQLTISVISIIIHCIGSMHLIIIIQPDPFIVSHCVLSLFIHSIHRLSFHYHCIISSLHLTNPSNPYHCLRFV